MKYFKQFFRRHRGRAVLAALLLLGQVMGTLLIPALIADVVDRGILRGNMDAILRTGVQMLVVAVLASAVAAWGSWVTSDLSALFGIGFPVVLILLISMMKRSVPEMPAEMFGIAAFTPGMAVFGLSFLSLFLGMLIANDRSSAFLMRLFACPMTGADYILGYSLPMLPLALLQGVVCYVTALFFGLPVSVNLLPGLAVLLVPAMLFIIIGAVNAVNLTDGIDGLASSVTMVAAMGFLVISSIEGFVQMNLLAAALAGVCLGFLVWNFHPAKVFMGDTGSMFLGGLVVTLAFGLRMPVILIFVGIVYVAETMSDIIQIGSVKLTGKRVFKMAPIHHHFEMCGWSEVKIVAVFSAVTALGCIIAVLMVL